MIVCSCNVLSDGQVRDCIRPGPSCPRTAAQVYQCLGCSPKCGRCARTIRNIMADALIAAGALDLGCAVACATPCSASHAPEPAVHHDAPPLETAAHV